MHKCMCECVNVHVWIYFFLKVSSDKTVIALIPPLVSKWHGFNPSRSISEPLGKKAGEGCCLLIQKPRPPKCRSQHFHKAHRWCQPTDRDVNYSSGGLEPTAWFARDCPTDISRFRSTPKGQFPPRKTIWLPLPQACHSLPCSRILQCLTSTADTEHSPGSSRAMRHSDWLLKHTLRDLPGGPVVNNRLPMQADLGSTLGWGTKVSHATEQLSLHPITRESLCSQKDK